MFEPCEFDRKKYLKCEHLFEADYNKKLIDGSKELSEFLYDEKSLAIELAYTRYYLAKLEKLVGV